MNLDDSMGELANSRSPSQWGIASFDLSKSSKPDVPMS